jgi:acyl-homoserine-lactone acylase
MKKLLSGLGLATALLAITAGALHLYLGTQKSNDFDAPAYIAKRADYTVTITRDTWGVPHIEGPRDRDAAFGFAYAQAEDHYQLIEDAISFYRGQQSTMKGYSAIPLDYLIALLDIKTSIDAQYDTALTPAARNLLTGFADGLNYWAAKNPNQVNQALYPVTPKDLVAGFAIQHLLFYGFQKPVMALFDDERKHDISTDNQQTAWNLLATDALPKGSNAFAVAPSRSTDGATRMLINSHQPLTGPVAWYEAHLRSDEGLHVMGGTFPGGPIISVGVNEHVAWGATVNHPDLVDIYVLDINPDNENQYRLDNQWVDFSIKPAAIRVKLLGNLYWTVNEDRFYSEHGPVLRTDHGDYAIRYAGQGEIRQIDQWLAMNKATSLGDWEDAMDQLAISSFNFVAADSGGNIGFYHNSQSPLRADGFNWQQYLPGDRSDLIWDSYLPFKQLPQVVNPSSGYLLSVNQSPFRVTAPQDNQQRSDFSESFGFPTRMTNRATRGLELFEAHGQISETDFKALKFDNHYAKQSRAMIYLQGVFNIDYPTNGKYQQAQQLLQNWDLSTDQNSTGAALGVCSISEEWKAEQAGREPPTVRLEFEKCVDQLHAKFGRADVAWGKVNRIIRGSADLPLNGGPDVLRAIYGLGLEDDDHLTAVAGDGLFIFASWAADGTQTIESIHQYGSNTLNESGNHYGDQMPLFVAEQMKPTYFTTEQLAKHTERVYTP